MNQLLLELWPYLAAFYLVDTLVLLRRGQGLFVVVGSRCRRVVLGETGVKLTHVSPGLEVVTTYRPPIFVGVDGVHVVKEDRIAAVPEADDLVFVAFGGEEPFEADGASVRKGPATVLRTPSERLARDVARCLRDVAALPVRKRLARIEKELRERHDVAAFRARRACALVHRRALLTLAWLLAATLFVVLPVSLFTRLPHRPPEGAVALTGLGIWASVVAFSARTLKRAGEGSVGATLVPMILCPPTAAHPFAVLTKELYGGFDPLTAAAALLPWDELRLLLRRELAWLRLARERLPEAVAPDLDRRADAVRALAEGLGHGRDELLAPPDRSEDAAAFCPLCHSTYRETQSPCSDCGVALEAF